MHTSMYLSSPAGEPEIEPVIVIVESSECSLVLVVSLITSGSRVEPLYVIDVLSAAEHSVPAPVQFVPEHAVADHAVNDGHGRAAM